MKPGKQKQKRKQRRQDLSLKAHYAQCFVLHSRTIHELLNRNVSIGLLAKNVFVVPG